MIFNEEPKSWSDLQDKVAQIGCLVEVEKDVYTARGKVNIDVFVKDTTKTPNLIYLCECKNWNLHVPKSVVHSFRTIVTDYGANVGFLISKKGFQAGAFDAALNSNVTLITWEQFQIAFLRGLVYR